jgi:CBS domain-containing membrane protein
LKRPRPHLPEPGPPPPTGPIGGHLHGIVRGLTARFQLRRLESRHDALAVLSLFSFINGCLSIAIMSLLALVTRQAFIFPSLGPTAFLFFYTPLSPTASPRNAVYGHLIGVGAGWGSLWLFRLEHSGPALAEGVDGARVGAAALSLGLTSGLMVLLKSPHPPAGATTLIISLGLLTEPVQMLVLMIAVLLLTGQAFVINRLAGLPYPAWAPPREPVPPHAPN